MSPHSPQHRTGATQHFSDTYSFLFTDIEGSTRRWEQRGGSMAAALSQHDALLREAIAAHRGRVFKTVGDAFCAVFGSPVDAVLASLAAQRALRDAAWPDGDRLRVRMAVHAGVAEQRDDDFFGATVNRVARILSAGHGGQVLVSSTVEEMIAHVLPADVRVEPLGEHRLKDVERAVGIAQVVADGLEEHFPPLRTQDMRPNNLPIQLTPFIGRSNDVANVLEALDRSRVVTLVGAGGIGKSRLALEVASDILGDFEDGAWFVPLELADDAEQVDQALVDALDVRERPATTPRAALLADLRTRSLLLLIDNCEHVIDAAAQVIDEIARSAPAVAVLATSQAPLGLAGEVVVPLGALDVPVGRRLPPVDSLRGYAAVGLFLDRARAVRPDFALTEANAAAVVGICRRLDGLALAIELAAARVRVLQPEQIHARLDNSLALLTGQARGAVPTRHHTLRAAIDWSYHLLDAEEQALLDRLTVFRGGWSLDAAEVVGAPDDGDASEVLDRLTQLVDKSLVQVEDVGNASRYRLLETIREYAAERLASSGRHAATWSRHTAWCVAMVREAAANLGGPDESSWMRRLSREHENVRSVLTRMAAPDADAVEGLRVATSLAAYWTRQGRLSEGRRWLEAFLERAGGTPTEDGAAALEALGDVAFRQGDYAFARDRFEACLVLHRAHGDRAAEARTLRSLGNVADEQGSYDEATDRYERSLALWRALGDDWGMAAVSNNLGLVARKRGDLAAAREHLEGSLERFQALGTDWAVGIAHANLGDVAVDQDDLPSAADHYSRSLAIARQLEDLEGIAYASIGLSDVARLGNDAAAAQQSLDECLATVDELDAALLKAEWLEARAALEGSRGKGPTCVALYAAGDALREGATAPLPESRRAAREAHLAAIRARDGDAAVDEAWRSGRRMSWRDAAVLAGRPRR